MSGLLICFGVWAHECVNIALGNLSPDEANRIAESITLYTIDLATRVRFQMMRMLLSRDFSSLIISLGRSKNESQLCTQK